MTVVFCYAALSYRRKHSNLLSFFLASNDRSLSRDIFAEGSLGSAVVATPELSFFVGCGSEGWRGIVEMIVSAMVSNTSGGGVPGCCFWVAMPRREECIGELKALGDCEGVIETVRFIEGLQQDDMKKRDHSLLLMREMEVKAREKS
ncbi:hypothetical protein Tco_1480734, partial [Tanacetum coccineum]